MKITDVSAVYPDYQHVAASWRTHFWQIVVRIESDAGVVGFGYGGGGVAAVEVVNRHFRELLVGRAVDGVEDIRAIWEALYAASLPYGRKGIAVMALSGVDLALWDLLSRAEGKPVHEMIGPRRKERVRSYATGTDPAWYAVAAGHYVVRRHHSRLANPRRRREGRRAGGAAPWRRGVGPPPDRRQRLRGPGRGPARSARRPTRRALAGRTRGRRGLHRPDRPTGLRRQAKRGDAVGVGFRARLKSPFPPRGKVRRGTDRVHW